MVPELKEGHTIHIDAFMAYWQPENRPLSPWHAKPENGGIDMYKEVETQRKIFKYWREKGFDVTGEGIFWAHPAGEGFVGFATYVVVVSGGYKLPDGSPRTVIGKGTDTSGRTR